MKHTRRSWWHLLATLVAFTLVATACGDGNSENNTVTDNTEPVERLYGDDDNDGATSTSEAQYGGSISVALEAETDNWLPGMGQLTVNSAMTVSRTFFDPLTMLNGDDEVVPFLAESVEPNSNLDVWTVTLRDGVRFHDGSRLDAETLVWNFDTLHNIEGSNTAGTINDYGIDEVEATGALTVEYRLSSPNSGFPAALRNSLGLPVSRQSYEEMGRDAFAEAPVGTGPFVFQSWTRDDRLVVTRNDRYWRSDEDGNQLPYLDQITFFPIADEDSRYQSLAADSVQVMMTLRGSNAKQVIDLAEERNYRADLTVTNSSGSSIFNTQRPPVDDVRVRRALVAASDGDSVAFILGDDGLVPNNNQFFSPENQWYSDVAAAAYPSADGPDVDLAEELLADYIDDPDRSDGRNPGDPIEIEYACPPDPSLLEIGQLYQDLWGNLGGGGMVEISLRQVQQPELIGNALSGDYMINCWRSGADEGDPLVTFQSWFSDPSTNPLNFTNFTHPEIDEAIEELRTSTDFEVRYAAAERINVIANENSILTWATATPHVIGWRDDLNGFTSWVMPNGDPGRGTRGAIIDFSQIWQS